MQDNAEVLDFSVRKSTDSVLSPASSSGEESMRRKLSVEAQDGEHKEEKPQQVRRGKRMQRMRPADEKLRAIERIHAGESKASVARDINVPESTIRGWCKSETAIRRCLQLKSPYDSEPYSPLSGSPVSSVGSTSDNLVIDMPRMSTNSSDEENHPQNECEQPAKKPKLETPLNETPLTPTSLQQDLRELANGDEKTPPDLLWRWLMFNQRLISQQLMPLLLPNGQSTDAKDALPSTMPKIKEEHNPDEEEKPKSADEAIAHGEKFLKWLEDCNDPSVTRFKVMQLKQLLCNLKSSKKSE